VRSEVVKTIELTQRHETWEQRKKGQLERAPAERTYVIRERSTDERTDDARQSKYRSEHSKELGAVLEASDLPEDGDHGDDWEEKGQRRLLGS
jgi:hypothetical protein